MKLKHLCRVLLFLPILHVLMAPGVLPPPMMYFVIGYAFVLIAVASSIYLLSLDKRSKLGWFGLVLWSLVLVISVAKSAGLF
ncbi:hypothetical protein ACFL1X_10300 [Candidatus Hydrogenedentota bacterium]